MDLHSCAFVHRESARLYARDRAKGRWRDGEEYECDVNGSFYGESFKEQQKETERANQTSKPHYVCLFLPLMLIISCHFSDLSIVHASESLPPSILVYFFKPTVSQGPVLG